MTWTFDALPANLPTGRRYVGWNRDPRGKVPCVPRCCARRASVTDPTTWDTFDTARGAVEDGKCDGLGLVLIGDVTTLDLDHSVDPTTRTLSADTTALIQAVPTYSEYSQSFVGIHVYLLGPLPPGPRRRVGLECYDRARFIALTGWHLDTTPAVINDHATTVTALYPQWFPTSTRPAPAIVTVPITYDDTVLLEKAHQARNGATFAMLWTGNTTGYPSHSEADAALCRQLAFWTQRDSIRMDRLFRQSGLYRSKWDDRRGSDTYGARTIAHAIATTPTVYQPPTNLLDLLEVPMA